MSSYGLKFSKSGVNVETAENKDLLISSQFDTFKVFRTGSLSLSLPTETLRDTQKSYTSTYTHNLGYIPFVLPNVIVGIGNPAPFEFDMVPTPVEYRVTTPYVINDVNDVSLPPGPFGFGPTFIYEVIELEVTSTQINLVITRVCDSMGNDVKFTASVGTLYYTIFYNRVDEEMDLL